MAGLTKQFHYEYDISMSCGGCSGAIDRVLKRLQGEDNDKVTEYEVSLDAQKAGINGEIDPSLLHEKIAKTKKQVNKYYVDGVEAPLPDLPKTE
ncbi:hypothetical protein MKZ38_006262 [Zalerion maritima]|uniref:HMA domain-containing protein n=1 Tax=Zalerion maritima TaxID=339359 RepID=A0AAD5RK15_9PEZI|nr:hypothetical protein MKZ38_006262 [Zalerion maritima]